jgi:hypothetical protein
LYSSYDQKPVSLYRAGAKKAKGKVTVPRICNIHRALQNIGFFQGNRL